MRVIDLRLMTMCSLWAGCSLRAGRWFAAVFGPVLLLSQQTGVIGLPFQLDLLWSQLLPEAEGPA